MRRAMTIVSAGLCVLLIAVITFLYSGLLDERYYSIAIGFIAFGTVLCIGSVVAVKLTGNDFFYMKKIHEQANALVKITEYNEKRKEIDSQIEYLMKQLTESEIAKYLDMNHLQLLGQVNYEGETVIDIPRFLRRFGVQNTDIRLEKGTAFMLTPFNDQGNELFEQCSFALKKLNIYLRQASTDILTNTDDILVEIVTRIVQAEIIIVNLNGRNPNVFYELGIAHTLGKATILLSRRDHEDEVKDLNFDINHKNIIFYDSEESLQHSLLLAVINITGGDKSGNTV